LSWQATSWAIKQRETSDPNQRFVLLCLANYAGPEGRSAFPAISTLAQDTGLSESTVRRKLQELEELKLISRGNQAIAAAHIERPDRRPVVYDLPIERGVTVLPRSDDGVSNKAERGVTERVTGCQALTPDPPSDPPLNKKTVYAETFADREKNYLALLQLRRQTSASK
jgi:DNA-binding transcriptional MocR family regulator